ncbi:unnamed protein product [Trifolium pratense]|uniref:Uncharacterized protein n=1 Tax=Trifolium pratense TaxID=57577 RepID=A0ACB0IG81_TRIPR|nr:unnamed protein product [Trifolium pratense]
MSVIKQKKEDGIIDTSKDINQLQEFYESYRKKNNIVDEEEMEMHFRESGDLSGLSNQILHRQRI